ncbi:TetR/AcrR family transcriptional regulator [Lactobacillaceae bacterium Melli_B4]
MSDLRRRRTELFVFQATNQLLREKSFSDITVNEIAEKSLVHRNTFYHHFEDKYDLLSKFIIYSLKDASQNVDISSFSHMPFHIIHELYMTSYHDVFKFQQNDDQFMNVFSNKFAEMFIEDMNDVDSIWTMGAISAILTWNDLNGHPYDMFNDYETLDEIYRTKQFPKLNY